MIAWISALVISVAVPRDAVCAAAPATKPSASATGRSFFMMFSSELFDLQDLVGIHPHDQVHELFGDFAPAMRRVGRNDDDIARSDLAAPTADGLAAARARTDNAERVRVCRVLCILDRSAAHHRPGARDHVIDLGDLAVLEA